MSDSNGVECKFYLRNGVGYKVYRSKRARDFAFRTQKLFHAEGLAPKVGYKFSWWGRPGYTTEVVRPAYRRTRLFKARLLTLKATSEKRGLCYPDDHIGNTGYLNNKLVFVDFGPLCWPGRL